MRGAEVRYNSIRIVHVEPAWAEIGQLTNPAMCQPEVEETIGVHDGSTGANGMFPLPLLTDGSRP
jgi:hypothetical protein